MARPPTPSLSLVVVVSEVQTKEAYQSGPGQHHPGRRRAVAAAYAGGLADAGLILPHVPDWAEPVWHLYVVRSPARDALQARLSEAGVGTLIHYPIPPHCQAAYAEMGLAPEALPLARRLAGEVLSLPIGPHLEKRATDMVIQCFYKDCDGE